MTFVFRANVIISDLPEYLPLLNKNVDLNAKGLRGKVRAETIVWGEDGAKLRKSLGQVDVILVSDCVYYEASLEPLVSTLLDLSEDNADCENLVSFEERESDQKQAVQKKFFELIEASFKVERIPEKDLHSEYCCPEIQVLRLQRA